MNQITEIGIIHTAHKSLIDIPIQPKFAEEQMGTIEIFDRFVEGLQDLDGFSHIFLIYRFHMVKGYNLKVVPYLDKQEHGVFATRAPKRPSAIGLSLVELRSIEKNLIQVKNIDVVDGTPLLDIKPYVAQFDEVKGARCGWIDSIKVRVESTKSDDRFI